MIKNLFGFIIISIELTSIFYWDVPNFTQMWGKIYYFDFLREIWKVITYVAILVDFNMASIYEYTFCVGNHAFRSKFIKFVEDENKTMYFWYFKLTKTGCYLGCQIDWIQYGCHLWIKKKSLSNGPIEVHVPNVSQMWTMMHSFDI